MMQEIPFREAMGKFMFVMIATIPYLAMVVGIVDQFMHKLQMDHYQAIKRILHYLQGTKDYWLDNTRP
jgi:hypothetical protein